MPALPVTLPRTFRSLATLRLLNVLAVGCSLAAVTGTAFGRIFGPSGGLPPEMHSAAALESRMATVTALSTLLFGVLWAVALRARPTIGRSSIRLGWILSLPLAMANAAAAGGLLFCLDHGSPTDFLTGAFVGATFGVLFWLPALLATLVCFGVPIAWSQRLAKAGLAGEERGELVVGAVCTLIACTAAALLASAGALPWRAGTEGLNAIAPLLLHTLAALGGGAGAVAAGFALVREQARRSFVRRVEAGDVGGYRVDATNEGKVLVRVTSMGEGYRVANFEEPLAVLDASGEVQRAMELRR